MRDFASCFNEYAVQVSDTSCSSYTNSSCISPGPNNFIPSIQNSVTCLYRAILPDTQKLIFINLTWCRSILNQGLSIAFDDDDPSSAVKLSTNSRLFRKLKGAKTVDFQGTAIELSWDLSTARYGSGPEPLDRYYVSVAVGSVPCLVLGDLAAKNRVNVKQGSLTGKFKLISRQEYFSGQALYSTRARFSDAGGSHDIVISCGGEDEGLKYPELSVCIDRKLVIRVKRLQWNFRGNQTIFLDGLLVDLMWDVHGWFYGSVPGRAVFMFKTRSGVDSRLWLEEKLVQKDQDKGEFSLTIYACCIHLIPKSNLIGNMLDIL